LLVAAAPANAGASKEESVGLGAGGVVGAVAGGPIGFIVGAAIGAKIGDTLHRKDDEIETLAAELDRSNGTITDLELDLAALNRDIDSMSDELDHLESVSNPELTRLLEAGVAIDLLFRTDEHALPDTTGQRFAELGRKLADMQQVHVTLDGFADQRGDAEYNQQLSEKRVAFVREQLVAAGVAAERISSTAHGEVAADDETLDSYALERRVSITLSLDSTPSFASMPD
ncbi:MAG: DUF456 family protein, partial [Pseudomonadota bacterium]